MVAIDKLSYSSEESSNRSNEYWLAKNKIPHTTNYVSLRNLIGLHFDSLRRGGNASYTSEQIIQEFLDVIRYKFKSLSCMTLYV